LISSTEQPRFQVFRGIPGRDFIEAFKAHVRETGQPETFEGLHPGPLAKTEPFEKLTPFDLDGRKRPEGDLAPCPMCQPNKYLHGVLAYFPRLQAVAAIGHCCADKETLAAAERGYRERRTQEQEEDYLLAELPLVHARLALIEQVQPAAAEALRAYRQFRSQAPEIQRLLRAAKKAGGRLAVSERIASEAIAGGPVGFRGGGQNTRDVDFGVLRGSIAVAVNYDPVRELDRIVGLLLPHDRGEAEETAIEYIAALDVGARHRATVNLREAESSYGKWRSRLADFCAFFAPENINRIRSWASHPAHPQPFTATATAGKDGSLACQIRDRSALICHVRINPVIRDFDRPWPRPHLTRSG
jgi:hypothetical protein